MHRLFFIVISALASWLIFAFEPMVGKSILPVFGGAPAVWGACLAFFQVILCVGYLLVHFLSRFGSFRLFLLQTTLLVCAGILFLFFQPNLAGSSVALLLLMNFGLPFVALSMMTPQLQLSWSQLTKDASPYWLYAVSNIGSLCGLISYPFLIEPYLSISQQRTFHGVSFLVLGAGTLILALQHRGGSSTTYTKPQLNGVDHAPTISTFCYWLLCAAIPSALLITVTTHITTDIAPLPLLWIAPLMVFLLCYIIAFSTLLPRFETQLSRFYPLIFSALLPFIFFDVIGSWWLTIVVHLAILFTASLWSCAMLASSQPRAALLTTFYSAIAIGGAIGGLSAVIAAPYFFNTLCEYPLLFLCTLLLGKNVLRAPQKKELCVIFGLIIYEIVLHLMLNSKKSSVPIGLALVYGAPLIAIYRYRLEKALFFLASSVIVIAVGSFCNLDDQLAVFRSRNLFGIKTVYEDTESNTRSLKHGRIIHGIESTVAAHSAEPLAYYRNGGPVSDVFELIKNSEQEVVVVGLGIGSIVCHTQRPEHLTFIEIDPLVKEIAESRFSILSLCGQNKAQIVIGDGRIELAKQIEHNLDLIIIDAFSSDAIPFHLLTDEAISSYKKLLNSEGILLFHISNLYLDIERVLKSYADHHELTLLVKVDLIPKDTAERNNLFPSQYAAFVSDPNQREFLITQGWVASTARPVRLWTDSYSSLAEIIR